ncbi:MAG: penicillin-binding protein 1A, partial [Bacteroidia bacterium]
MAGKKTPKKSTKKSLARLLWRYYLLGLSLFVLFMFTVSWGWWGYMPDVNEVANPNTTLATEIYSEDEELLGKLYRLENRTNIEFGDIPPYMVEALVATEDVRFYSHSGIDIKALVRAVTRLGRDGGGSTISQQLAKNLFHDLEGNNKIQRVIQKFKEWIIAVKLERQYTKDEIITLYFNTVRWGNSSGIKSAAKTFFNKPVISLKKEESAVLVGMLRAPSKYNPHRNPNNATLVRNVVLNQMEKYDYIPESECDSLKSLKLVLDYNFSSHNRGMATYLRERVHRFMKKWCRE